MADVNFKGRKQYRRFPLSLRLQVIEDSPVGETAAKTATRIFTNLSCDNRMIRGNIGRYLDHNLRMACGH